MKKGFTLIELLAVIVILAVIALIATPIITGIIDDTKLKSYEQSVNGIIETVNNYYVTSILKGPKLEKGKVLELNSDGTAHFQGEVPVIPLNYKGQKPNGGKIYIDTLGKITASGLTFDNNIICNMTSGENGCIHAELDSNKNVIDNDAISYIKSKAGSSLVDDPSDDKTRKMFRGDNNIPNYINIKENNSDVKYRIVSIESDGTIKVIRNDLESTRRPWDQTDIMNAPAQTGPRLNESNTFCMRWDKTARVYVDSEGEYYGCNAWNAVDGVLTLGIFSGTVKQNASLNDYLNNEFYNNLDTKMKNIIVTHSFDTGEIHWENSYNAITSEIKRKSWQGKIGLITALDWFNAADSTTGCTTDVVENGWVSGSKTNTSTNHATEYPCSDKNYLYNGSWWWTISPNAGSRGISLSINYGGLGNNNTCYSSGVRPTFYITSNIKLSGEGTSTKPFIIE